MTGASELPSGIDIVARTLIVDDSLLCRSLLGEILRDAGHEVVGEAADGLQAPQRVRELQPELVTLDLVMPGRDGLLTLRHLLMIDPALVVIVCSAALDAQRVLGAVRLGAKGFIAKPFTRSSAREVVEHALDGSSVAARSLRGGAPPPPPPDAWVTEQREFVRVGVALRVVLQEHRRSGYVQTETINLSAAGMLLGGGGLDPGVRVGFRIELDGAASPIDGRGRVVRVARDGRMAVAFEQIAISDHERLVDYIRKLELEQLPLAS